MSASIGYANLLESASSVTASTTVDGDVANLSSGLLHDYWQGTGSATDTVTVDTGAATTRVDYVGLAGHTLISSGATWKLQYSTDNSTWYDVDIDKAVPASDGVICGLFSYITARYWRLHIVQGATAAIVSQFALGRRWDLPVGMRPGYVPLHLAGDPKTVASVNEVGTFVGRSLIRDHYRTTLPIDYLTADQVRDDLEPFMAHAEVKPFFWVWDRLNRPLESAYCWSNGPMRVATERLYYRAELPIEGVI